MKHTLDLLGLQIAFAEFGVDLEDNDTIATVKQALAQVQR